VYTNNFYYCPVLLHATHFLSFFSLWDCSSFYDFFSVIVNCNSSNAFWELFYVYSCYDTECEVNAYRRFRFAIAHVLFWPEQEYCILKTIFQKAVLKVHKSKFAQVEIHLFSSKLESLCLTILYWPFDFDLAVYHVLCLFPGSWNLRCWFCSFSYRYFY